MNSERWLFEDIIDPAIHAEIQKMLQPLAKDLKAQCLFGARERYGAAFDMGTTALPQPATGVLTSSESTDRGDAARRPISGAEEAGPAQGFWRARAYEEEGGPRWGHGGRLSRGKT